ncbi:ComEC family competence protein [Siccirubricoccus sp. KC 17139]|uniref:ComEC family competence protein n=1 Tax=Siccirubricoccus soli TaxID=2899147 RepID=A0ABT1D6E5_9PROT|nr:ComEC/Rec2 family competence protein [Siccirubricoccus soli]MCO6416774.1 ComEC family competence protein [Siccirubricoccus soli]MCP2682909.1 ComEC family competence protein [Siccirubricoccus soli]
MAAWLGAPLLVIALLARRLGPLPAWALGLAAAAAIGFGLATWHAGRQPPMPELPRGATILTGRIAQVELLPEGRRLTIAAPSLDGGAPLARQVRVRLKADDPARPAPGDGIRLRALVRPPSAPAYPGAWDFQQAAFFSGLAGSGFALGRAEVTPGAAGPAFAALRAGIEARVTAAIPGPAGAVAAALLTGGQSAIPPADLGAMRESGLAHLLSVSGLHIAIVMGLGFWLLRAGLALVPAVALRLPVKPIAALGALALGGAYLALTGGQVPMLRSFAMAALVTLALLAGRRALSLRGWALAATLVLAVNPAAVLGASFQMSFAAVLALIAGWEWLRPRLPRPELGGWRRRLWLAGFGLVATSLLAGAATTPFGLHHFGRLQLYGVAANALAVPLTSLLVMPAGMAAAALMPFGLERWALLPMGWGVEGILAIARCVAAWPGASLAVPPIPAWGLGLASFGMLWLCLWQGPWRGFGLPLILLGLLSGLWERPPDILVSGDGRLIAFRADEGMFLQRQSGASAFTREAWQRLFGVAEARALPREGAAGGMACTAGACTLRAVPEGPAVALLRGAAPAAHCAGAALVISAEPVRGHCAAQVIDRFTVWRHGPHAVWLAPDGVRVVSDRQWRGDRLWVPPMPVPRGSASAEPPAAME